MKLVMGSLLLVVVVAATGCTTTAPDGTVLRSPAGNAALCLLVGPGTGQYCNEQPGKGTLMLLGSLAAAIGMHLTEDPDVQDAFLGLFIALEIWSAVDAYVVAKAYNRKLGHAALDLGIGYDPSTHNPMLLTALRF